MGMFVGFFLLIGLLLFIAIVIGVVLWAVVSSRRSRNGEHITTSQHTSQSPQDMLKERYARGEIDREEYLRRKQDLE
jgi:putative membrane protein